MTSVLDQSQPLPLAEASVSSVKAKRFSKPKLLLTTAILTVSLAGSFEDQSGVEVDLEDGESLHGQLGTRFTVPMQYAEIYLNAGVKHQFLGEAEATVSGLTFTNDMPGTQGLIAAGLQAMSAEDQLFLSLETAYAKGADASELSGSFNMELKF